MSAMITLQLLLHVKSEDPVVMMSLEYYNAMQETTYLLRSPANLLEFIAELEASNGTKRKLIERS
ncbi:hypothetical protein [Colwellia sp. M166]|uniref:hypothetical protein n=1 Tax=Colwellia sp. M166 TaxID=2583805 RepID=UPI00211DE450|nr:hypothetical protein [Colwellia sp. M166]|tara:strand:+ start:3913 stop:4107 length:195 start_codon:yes stop_codon:yes gene_type:complete